MMPKHIKKAADLITSREATRAGFLFQATKKAELAAPHIIRAWEFGEALARVKKPDELLEKLPEFRQEFIAAAGISVKSSKHLSDDDLEITIKESLRRAQTEKDFRRELVDRYLLTKGDSLGGTMRNVIGGAANEEVKNAIFTALTKTKFTPKVKRTDSGKVREISWGKRLLRFDYKSNLLDKNVDEILLDTSGLTEVTNDAFNDPERYVAAGELKGGIDPAGADEHWKTGDSALRRIASHFPKGKVPKIFFVGKAIEKAMSEEIFAQLKKGHLAYAANMTSKVQLASFAEWITSL